MANTKIIEKKKKAVSELAKKFKESELILLADYRGINVEDATELRKELRNINAEYTVIKNNIVKRALNENGITELDDILVGPTAVITSKEEYLPATKIIYNYSKDNDFYKIKGGLIEGNIKEVEEIVTLAQLPSREELIAKLAGVLLANIQKLAVAVDQVAKQKEEGQEEPAEEANEAKEESEEKAEEVKEEKVEEAKETEAETKEETEEK